MIFVSEQCYHIDGECLQHIYSVLLCFDLPYHEYVLSSSFHVFQRNFHCAHLCLWLVARYSHIGMSFVQLACHGRYVGFCCQYTRLRAFGM